MPPIYLDYNASTPIDPAVVSAMRPFLSDAFGNPSSGDWASTPAKAALDRARRMSFARARSSMKRYCGWYCTVLGDHARALFNYNKIRIA